MGRIKGISVTLITEEITGTDPFGNPIATPVEEEVDNVLVAPASADDIVSSTNLFGKKAVYTLAIPKSDTHNWKDAKVRFFNQTFRVFGEPLKGIDSMIPLDWNTKVMVEVYE